MKKLTDSDKGCIRASIVSLAELDEKLIESNYDIDLICGSLNTVRLNLNELHERGII